MGKAAELIDLTRHSGEHPRIGATDVLPFVPLEGVSMAECVAVARRVGEEALAALRDPCLFLRERGHSPRACQAREYSPGTVRGAAGGRSQRPSPSARSGPGRGTDCILQLGAVAVGARKLLIAYNITLSTADVSVAEQIARAIRELQRGRLPAVKAIGALRFDPAGSRRCR